MQGHNMPRLTTQSTKILLRNKQKIALKNTPSPPLKLQRMAQSTLQGSICRFVLRVSRGLAVLGRFIRFYDMGCFRGKHTCAFLRTVRKRSFGAPTRDARNTSISQP